MYRLESHPGGNQSGFDLLPERNYERYRTPRLEDLWEKKAFPQHCNLSPRLDDDADGSSAAHHLGTIHC